MADDKTDLKKLGNIIMPSTHQLSKEICKMLEKRGKAQPAANPKDVKHASSMMSCQENQGYQFRPSSYYIFI
jgi:hypothetical protein